MQWGEKTHTHTHTKVTVFNSAQCHTLVSLTSSLTKEFGPNTNQSPSITTWREKFAGQKWVAVNIWTLCHKVFTICSHRMKGVGRGRGGRDWLGRTHMSRSRTSREYHKAIQAASAEFRGRLLPQAPEWHWFEIFEMFIPPDVFHRSLFHLCDILGLFYIQVLFFFSLSLFHLKIWVRMHVSWFFCVLGTIITMLEYFTVKWGKHVFWGSLHLHAVQSDTVLEIDHF